LNQDILIFTHVVLYGYKVFALFQSFQNLDEVNHQTNLVMTKYSSKMESPLKYFPGLPQGNIHNHEIDKDQEQHPIPHES
jgi:hypothetical protein